MFKKTNRNSDRTEKQARELLSLEVSEIEEIGEKLYQKLDRRIADLRDAEKKVDEKMRILENLLLRAEAVVNPGDSIMEMRRQEISALSGRGLKIDEIAGMFDIPRGEVELILGLGR